MTVYIYCRGSGRFGNIFFRNMAAHFISQKNNVIPIYENIDNFNDLGIILFNSDAVNSDVVEYTKDINDIYLTEENFMDYITKEHTCHHNLFLKNIYCQTKEFSIFLYQYFSQINVKQQIIYKNQYSNRYNDNNDVYLHIRLGDSVQFNPGKKYYDDLLSKLKFTNGYISSDSPKHPICSNLIEKFNLNILDLSFIDTIKFGSTCKYIILSNGTFSYMIGLLGFYSEIYYPKLKTLWHGDIFLPHVWNEIELN